MLLCFVSTGRADVILFTQETDGYWQLWATDLDDREAIQLTTSPVDKRRPHLIGPGPTIAYHTAEGRLVQLELRGGTTQPLLPQMGVMADVTLDPSSERLVVTRMRSDLKDDSDLWSVQRDGSDPRQLTHLPGLQHAPTASPDGARLVFVSGSGGKYDLWQTSLVSDSEGGELRQLTQTEARELLPQFSPDGETVLYVSNAEGSYDLYAMRADGSTPQRLTQHPGFESEPTWSPDGKSIAFAADWSGSLQIWIAQADGSNPRQLTHDERPATQPLWLEGTLNSLRPEVAR